MAEWDGRYGADIIKDRGHTKICGKCGKGHGEDPSKVGKPRSLDFEVCFGCKAESDREKVRKPEIVSRVRVGPGMRRVAIGRRW